MKTSIVIMAAACVGVCPVWAHPRLHHIHAPAARTANPPMRLQLQDIAYAQPDERDPSGPDYGPGVVVSRDRIPTGAADHFGRGGVASVGYLPGSKTSLVEPHELNAAFSSQPTVMGGVVGGGVSIQF
jgi:hypothetical protein